MNASPLLITAKDDELVGASSHSDAMGVLAIWSIRGRDLVPHLTEQNTNIRGFQILVEAFRLWELYYEPVPPSTPIGCRPDNCAGLWRVTDFMLRCWRSGRQQVSISNPTCVTMTRFISIVG